MVFLSDEGPVLETLDYTICIGSTPTFLSFYIFICISTLPMQHTTFILLPITVLGKKKIAKYSVFLVPSVGISRAEQ